MREILELIIVLTTICLVAAFSLAKVYDLTKEPIAEQKRLARMQAVNAVLPPHNNEPDQDTAEIRVSQEKKGEKTILIYKGLKDGQLVGLAFEVWAMGFNGEVGAMLGLDPNGIIQGVEITNMSETPGLGAKITEPPFKGQFQGKSLLNARFQLKKEGGDLDHITGATISPRAVVQAVRGGLEFFQEYKSQIVH